ncbi:MAG: NUDIX hydrolase [Nocardioidaceae bacterium]
MNHPSTVLASGSVVWREAADGVEVLLVHRPRYDDWSFPKGKLDDGEHLVAAAVREVCEETGLTVRLGVPLPDQEYVANGLPKRVHYWSSQPVGDTAVDSFEPNREVDRVLWTPVDRARSTLTYPRDVEVLEAFTGAARQSSPLLLLRHAQAHSRDSWAGDDQQRTLSPDGVRQARDLVPLLQAYGVERLVSSNAVRCISSLQRYADRTGVDVELDHRLSERGADEPTVTLWMQQLLAEAGSVAVCGHRPLLPRMFEALGVDDPGLRTGELVVVHRRDGRVSASERHRA